MRFCEREIIYLFVVIYFEWKWPFLPPIYWPGLLGPYSLLLLPSFDVSLKSNQSWHPSPSHPLLFAFPCCHRQKWVPSAIWTISGGVRNFQLKTKSPRPSTSFPPSLPPFLYSRQSLFAKGQFPQHPSHALNSFLFAHQNLEAIKKSK